MSTTVLVSTFPPFPTLSFAVPSETQFQSLYDLLQIRYPSIPVSDDLYLSPQSGAVPSSSTPVSALHCYDSEEGRAFLTLRLSPRLRAGKGGFGSQLRAAGGRMSSQKTNNNDSCRDLSGRRLSTVKEAQKLAAYLEAEPQRKKAAKEAEKAKLEALEKRLGEQSAGRKHRLDDTEYVEQSREIQDNVRSAVTAGLLKRKKKAKMSHTPEGSASATTTLASSSGTLSTRNPMTDIAEKIVDSSATASVVAVASAAVGVASG